MLIIFVAVSKFNFIQQNPIGYTRNRGTYVRSLMVYHSKTGYLSLSRHPPNMYSCFTLTSSGWWRFLLGVGLTSLYGSLWVTVAMVSSMAWSLWSHYGQCPDNTVTIDYDNKHSDRGHSSEGQVSNILWALRRTLEIFAAPSEDTELLCSRCLYSLSADVCVVTSTDHHHDTMTISMTPSLLWLWLESWQHCHQWNAV